ncbi:hypothetical protein [Reyranella sp.]|uniref:hypothetical protein n=1 Tax=Reyranella sp. TaxID=1929291 RepID=UPI003F6F61E7
MVDLTDYLQIHDRDLDDLVAALRRHDRAEANRLLERWATSEREIDEEADEDVWDDDMLPLLLLDHDLSAWVHREACDHVTSGRFEHALCLVETYRRPSTAADMAARLTFPQEAQR